MKLVKIAALASLFVFGSAFADATTTTTATTTAVVMSAEECATKLAQCGADQACKDELVKQGCKSDVATH
jgi:hypothetical protein